MYFFKRKFANVFHHRISFHRSVHGNTGSQLQCQLGVGAAGPEPGERHMSRTLQVALDFLGSVAFLLTWQQTDMDYPLLSLCQSFDNFVFSNFVILIT